ncbi:hypothetical protein E3J85_00770 [Patescibacteria group bacterium]|nr:MAG: hypothetical protein E3J85_00770 [Patescibacteria group bacterium]
MYYYIVNPTAGSRQFEKIQDEFLASLKLKKIEGEIARTTTQGEAKKLAKMGISKGCRMIIAVGGDATVEEVLNGIIESEKAGVALGVIPTGKNNYFANLLGISDWQVGINALASGKVRKMDVAQAGNYYFVSSLDFGFPLALESIFKKNRQKLNFWKRFRVTLDLIEKFDPIKLRLKVANHYWADLEIFAGSFGNAFFFNRPESFKISPDLVDQKLQALFLHPFEQKSLWYKAWDFSKGFYRSIGQFSLIKEKRFILESEQEVSFRTAAYRFSARKLNLTLHPKALSVVIKPQENSSQGP